MRNCKKCGLDIEHRRKGSIFCSKECNVKYWKENNKDRKNQLNRESYNRNKNSKKIYYQKNKSKRKEYLKNWKENNKEYSIEYMQKWRKENKDYNKNYIKNWRENNKDYNSKYHKNKMKNDLVYNLSIRIRNSIRKIFKENKMSKNLKTQEILGCSYEEFKSYLESKFETWMNWDNKGKYNGKFNYGWDIDHIIPISSAKTEEEVIKLNHYTNLQPLCSYVNRVIKKDKIIQ